MQARRAHSPPPTRNRAVTSRLLFSSDEMTCLSTLLSQPPVVVAQAKEPTTILQQPYPPPIIMDAGDSTVSSPTAETVEPSPTIPEDKETEKKQMAIIQILSDGSSRDLIEISTELQVRNQGFLDLNQVKKLCEGLVSQRKLRRTTEG